MVVVSTIRNVELWKFLEQLVKEEGEEELQNKEKEVTVMEGKEEGEEHDFSQDEGCSDPRSAEGRVVNVSLPDHAKGEITMQLSKLHLLYTVFNSFIFKNLNFPLLCFALFYLIII